jgi:hypothetical protein
MTGLEMLLAFYGGMALYIVVRWIVGKPGCK